MTDHVPIPSERRPSFSCSVVHSDTSIAAMAAPVVATTTPAHVTVANFGCSTFASVSPHTGPPAFRYVLWRASHKRFHWKHSHRERSHPSVRTPVFVPRRSHPSVCTPCIRTPEHSARTPCVFTLAFSPRHSHPMFAPRLSHPSVRTPAPSLHRLHSCCKFLHHCCARQRIGGIIIIQ